MPLKANDLKGIKVTKDMFT
uniref:Uncharacterized protein n=1 Tax=Arundo donax TaxID=35708 RepID=A0A0A9AX39_ARUDO